MLYMTSQMAHELGYDMTGNAPHLLCDKDKVALDHGDFIRYGQDVVCVKCGMVYGTHPPVQGALWLRRTCMGLVKL